MFAIFLLLSQFFVGYNTAYKKDKVKIVYLTYNGGHKEAVDWCKK